MNRKYMILACVALTFVGVIALLPEGGACAYRADCRFVYWHDIVKTNAFGDVCQIDYTGPAAESLLSPILQGRDVKFKSGVVGEILAEYHGSDVDVGEVSNLVDTVRMEVIGRPIPVVRISVVASSEEVARRVILAYVSSLGRMNDNLQRKRHLRAIEQVSVNIDRLRKQMDDHDGSGGYPNGDSHHNSVAGKLEKDRLQAEISKLEAVLRKMENKDGEGIMRVQIIDFTSHKL